MSTTETTPPIQPQLANESVEESQEKLAVNTQTETVKPWSLPSHGDSKMVTGDKQSIFVERYLLMAGSHVFRNMMSLTVNTGQEVDIEENAEIVRFWLSYEEGAALKPKDVSLKQLRLLLRFTKKYECLRAHAFFISWLTESDPNFVKAKSYGWISFGLFLIAAEFDLPDVAQKTIETGTDTWVLGGNKGTKCLDPHSWTQRQADLVPLRYYVALVRAYHELPGSRSLAPAGSSKVAEAFGRYIKDAGGGKSSIIDRGLTSPTGIHGRSSGSKYEESRTWRPCSDLCHTPLA